MTDPTASAREFARFLNDQARSLMVEDGEHASMFFLLLPDGRVEVDQFDEVDRPVGDSRAQQLVDSARKVRAEAVAFISEAWSAPADAVPEGFGAGDSTEASDVLVVAAADRGGGYISIETPVFFAADNTVALGDSAEHEDSSYQVRILDEVRAMWSRETT